MHNMRFLLVITEAALFILAAASATSLRKCSPCGKYPVPYPLSTGPTCGDQSYKIKCNNGTLTFPTSNNTYRITSIEPEFQRLVIKPANFIPNSCVTEDIWSHGVQLNQTLPFNITGDNTIMFFNCSESLLRAPLNCTSSSLCHVYINSSRDGGVYPCQKSQICCAFKAGGGPTAYSIRVREEGCRAYRSFTGLNPNKPVSQWGQPGLMIQWMLPQEPVCRGQADCAIDGGNSTCRPDPITVGSRRCFCNSPLHWDAVNGVCAQENICRDPDGCIKSHGIQRTALIAGLASGLLVFLIFCTVTLVYYRHQRRIKEQRERLKREREEILNTGGGRTAKIFSGKEIKNATNNFSREHLLGVGGFGEVYKGVLGDGTLVAVKCAKVGNNKGTEQILNEVRILCQVHHRHLVGLLGCCVDLEQPILVYEFISNGTLYDQLRRSRTGGLGLHEQLSWTCRLKIAYQTAEALTYLHFSASPPIYHRDVKSSNILLDEKMDARVSDFGLSRLAETDVSHISTCAQGTLGYLDPEYYTRYQLTDKSDVYSFGVVLLELLTSQKVIDFNRDEDDVNLAIYIKRLVGEDRLMDAMDPCLRGAASPLELESMKRLGILAIRCLEENRQNRPSMKEVAEEIDHIIGVATGRMVIAT